MIIDIFRKLITDKSPVTMLFFIAIAASVANTGWRVVMNNFAIEVVGMTGEHVGILQSLREIPGLLSFTVLFLLLIMSEQKVALLSLATLGVGVALTGYFPSIYGFYFTTVLMSIGFHYLDAINQSLSTQIISKNVFGTVIGDIKSASSFFSTLTFLLIILMTYFFNVEYLNIFLFTGGVCFLLSLYLFFWFEPFVNKTPQKNKVILRWRYCKYYILTFLSGARRQIFVVFASLLMVDKFEYSVTMIAILFLVSGSVTTLTAPFIGRLIDRIGEKNGLLIEYGALILVFVSYAFVGNHYLAGALYILDNVIFSFAIALSSYFKKIVTEDEVSSSSGVSFTINHIAAVFLPFLLGMMWVLNYDIVFFIGALISLLSFLVALTIPNR